MIGRGSKLWHGWGVSWRSWDYADFIESPGEIETRLTLGPRRVSLFLRRGGDVIKVDFGSHRWR